MVSLVVVTVAPDLYIINILTALSTCLASFKSMTLSSETKPMQILETRTFLGGSFTLLVGSKDTIEDLTTRNESQQIQF